MNMDLTVADLVVWLVLGALAGHLTGLMVKRSKAGFGHGANLGIGMAGALIGGLLFQLFGLLEGLQQVAINLQDIVAAVAGSLLFLLVLRLIRRR